MKRRPARVPNAGPDASESGRSNISTTVTTTPEVKAQSDTGTGIARWWNYTLRKVPGIGVAMLNPGTGNLLVAADDVDVRERGVNLSFKRFYNSQSLHDEQGDDGGQQSIFGNRWTNNLDMHLIYSPTTGSISVYDATGRRCDYTAYLGSWKPCAGEFASLYPDPSDSCSYWWVQRDGTAYYFKQPGNVASCGTRTAMVGRLYEIVGRNSNNNIQLTYSYPTGGPYDAQHITEIDANHSDGQSLILSFEPVGANSYNELVSIKRPGGATLRYSYDDNGNLLEVDKPGNDETSDPSIAFIYSQPYNVPAGDLPETYSVASGQPLQLACGPQATISMWANGGTGTRGSCIRFDFDGAERLIDWIVRGVMSFIPSDGTSSEIQPGNGGWTSWMTSYFDYGQPVNCTGLSQAQTTTMCDTDGHSTVWTYNQYGMVTQEQASTGASSGITALVTTQTWATTNQLAGQPAPFYLTSSTSPAGYTASYNYNQGAESPYEISLSPASGGSFSPYFLFKYDGNGNVLSICDPTYNRTHGNPSSCPTTPSGGNQVFVYNTSDAAEPNGVLTDAYSPTGYDVRYAYNYGSAQESGDYGLPTTITPSAVKQADGTPLQPSAESIAYDATGNVSSDTIGSATTDYSYDSQNRETVEEDPDGVRSYKCYNRDGSVQAVESALQHQMDPLDPTNPNCGNNALSFSRDADGNVIAENRHYDGVVGTTQSWYDGLDRLVEVEVPGDSTTDNNNPMLQRYIYDLTQSQGNASLNITGRSGTFHGYGNMYKTERFFSGNWNDISGNAYDALDRAVRGFERTPTDANGQNPGPMEDSVNTYDATAQTAGLLTSVKDANGVTKNYSYDGNGRVTSVAYSDGTPTATYTYDPNSRVLTASNSVAKDTYIYNSDGSVASSAESGVTAPIKVAYNYLENGWRASEVVQANGLVSQTYNYFYQADGLISSLQLTGQPKSFKWTYTSGGRLLSQSDPLTGSGPFTDSAHPNGVTIGAKSADYDKVTGMLKDLTMPNGMSYSNFTYDAEGDLTSFAFTPNGVSFVGQNGYVTGVQYHYNVRGEMSEVDGITPSLTNYEPIQHIHTFYGHPETCVPGETSCYDDAVDPYTGALVGSGGTDASGCHWSRSMSYDLDGRSTTDTVKVVNTGTGQCDESSQTFVRTRTFDAEARTLTDGCPGIVVAGIDCGADNVSYSWGADGHVRQFTSYGQTQGVHWDANQLLLLTKGTTGIALTVGKLAATAGDLKTLVVLDGESSGLSVESHSASGDSGNNVVPDRWSPKQGLNSQDLTGAYPGVGAQIGPGVDMQRTDGYGLGQLVLQGGRAYDQTSLQWMTPDYYRGDPGDPMSQMPYTWNSNNPLGNLDPSGFCKSTTTADPSELCTIIDECVTPSGACKPKPQPPPAPPQLRMRSGPDPIINGPPAPAAITTRLGREIEGLNQFGQVAAGIGTLPLGGPLLEEGASALGSWAIGGGSVRVFWSGYGLGAKGAAISYAAGEGYVTLEMTPAGRVLNAFTNSYTSRMLTGPWSVLSRAYAASAQGGVHAFIYSAGNNSGNWMGPGQTWANIELPTLINNPFVTHIVWH